MSDRPMRVDVVTAPVRYRRAPLAALVVFAAVPALALSALLVWSDRHADAYEATDVDAVPSAPPPTGPPVPELDTAVLAWRRAPAALARQAAGIRLATAMDQLYVFVGEGSCVAVAVDGHVVSSRFADAPVIPASTHKLLVATVALEVLGAEHRFTTQVKAPEAVDGVVQGDVYLIGGGDPVLTSDAYPIDRDSYPAFNTTSLDALADAVAATGIRGINGNVVGDGTRYDDEWAIRSWGPGVAGVEAGPYDALLVNDARVVGRTGRQSDPNVAAAREFARLLNERGIWVAGWRSGEAPAELPVVASIESATLDLIVDELLTTSDDDTAEMLLKELGFADSGAGTVAGGLDVVDRTLRSWDVPMNGVRLVDASGLSAENRLTCAALVAVLDRIVGTRIADGLPVAGRTGTLTGELLGTAVEGRLRAKTGSLGNPPAGSGPPGVKGLAGILDAPDGSAITFALVLNVDGIEAPEGYRPYWDALAVRLAEYPVQPDVTTLGPR